MTRTEACSALTLVCAFAQPAFSQANIQSRYSFLAADGNGNGNNDSSSDLFPYSNSVSGGGGTGGGTATQTSSVSSAAFVWTMTASFFGDPGSPGHGGPSSGAGESSLTVYFSVADPTPYSLVGSHDILPFTTSAVQLELDRMVNDQASALYTLPGGGAYSTSGTLVPGDYRLTVRLSLAGGAGAGGTATAHGTMTFTPAPGGVALAVAGGAALLRRRRRC